MSFGPSTLGADDSTASQPHQNPEHQPDAVKFIDTHLLDLHDALKDPMSIYDSHSGRYVPASLHAARLEATEAAESHIIEPDISVDITEALIPLGVSMTFWDRIFEKSVDRFKASWADAPKDRERSGWNYSIRDRSTWEEVYAQLQKARELYDGDTKGLWGRHAKSFTKKRREFVDQSVPMARQAVRFVPSLDYTTPVIAAVQVLVDVSRHDTPNSSAALL